MSSKWTQEERLAAARVVCADAPGGESENEKWAVYFEERGNSYPQVDKAIDLQCEVTALREALEPFIDDEECSYDHHGYCQTHGVGPIPCHMKVAREVLEKCK